MLEADVIEPAMSDYNSPIVLVKKKDGTNIFCVDFRRINLVTKFDTEPMGNPEDIMAKLKDDKFFSKIDLSKGFWQIMVEKSSQHLTAFSTMDGSYTFKKIAFGLVNSGITFNRMMSYCCMGVETQITMWVTSLDIQNVGMIILSR